MDEEKFQRPIIKLAGVVHYDEANDLWHFAVAAPNELDAALVAGAALRHVLDARSKDPSVIRDLIDRNFDMVERYVATAELNKWPEEMAVFPLWKDDKDQI